MVVSERFWEKRDISKEEWGLPTTQGVSPGTWLHHLKSLNGVPCLDVSSSDVPTKTHPPTMERYTESPEILYSNVSTPS